MKLSKIGILALAVSCYSNVVLADPQDEFFGVGTDVKTNYVKCKIEGKDKKEVIALTQNANACQNIGGTVESLNGSNAK